MIFNANIVDMCGCAYVCVLQNVCFGTDFSEWIVCPRTDAQLPRDTKLLLWKSGEFGSVLWIILLNNNDSYYYCNINHGKFVDMSYPSKSTQKFTMNSVTESKSIKDKVLQYIMFIYQIILYNKKTELATDIDIWRGGGRSARNIFIHNMYINYYIVCQLSYHYLCCVCVCIYVCFNLLCLRCVGVKLYPFPTPVLWTCIFLRGSFFMHIINYHAFIHNHFIFRSICLPFFFLFQSELDVSFDYNLYVMSLIVLTVLCVWVGGGVRACVCAPVSNQFIITNWPLSSDIYRRGGKRELGGRGVVSTTFVNPTLNWINNRGWGRGGGELVRVKLR